MSADADLLFYGCDLAATDDGRELMNQVGAECDCDVAASDDLTGHADDEHRRLAVESGCDEYLVKPVGINDLAEFGGHFAGVLSD